ncbi:MAG TPA: methyltransferase domain-containing protein [Longimicrobium sp.]|nr:methyltransferase domain-containing protein [Longimicrobium sp.]
MTETQPQVLQTTAGEFPLHESHLRLSDRDWSVLHTGVLLTFEEEQTFLSEFRDKLPYGVAMWPSGIALAHEVLARAGEFRGKRVLELGAGTGLPGIVASSLGARVVQTDRHEVAMAVCRRNGERNGAVGIEYRLADWSEWADTARYDWILGADILYGDAFHANLRQIFSSNLAPGGRVLLTDPFRPHSLRFLEALEGEGWKITMSKWMLGDEEEPKPIGAFEITPP